MSEVAQTQDKGVGGETASVIVLAVGMLQASHQFLEKKRHPTVVIQATFANRIDLEDANPGRKIIQSWGGTKIMACKSCKSL